VTLSQAGRGGVYEKASVFLQYAFCAFASSFPAQKVQPCAGQEGFSFATMLLVLGSRLRSLPAAEQSRHPARVCSFPKLRQCTEKDKGKSGVAKGEGDLTGSWRKSRWAGCWFHPCLPGPRASTWAAFPNCAAQPRSTPLSSTTLRWWQG